MKKLEIKGLGGLHIEVYDTKNSFTELEMMKEAEKAIRRAVIYIESGGKRYESHPYNNPGR